MIVTIEVVATSPRVTVIRVAVRVVSVPRVVPPVGASPIATSLARVMSAVVRVAVADVVLKAASATSAKAVLMIVSQAIVISQHRVIPQVTAILAARRAVTSLTVNQPSTSPWA